MPALCKIPEISNTVHDNIRIFDRVWYYLENKKVTIKKDGERKTQSEPTSSRTRYSYDLTMTEYHVDFVEYLLNKLNRCFATWLGLVDFRDIERRRA